MIGNHFFKDIKFIQQNFGWTQAFNLRILPTLKSKLLGINYYECFNSSLIKFLEKEFEDIINDYKQKEHLFLNKEITSDLPIWVCWWQGKEQMPELIDKCYQYLLKNANGREVILITKDNYKKFTDIPIFILKKVENGNISFTHLSDIIRFNLLKNHGGIWIDAAMWVTKPIEIPNLPLYTLKLDLESDSSVSNFKWSIGLIAMENNNILSSFINNFSIRYWEKYDKVIVYFLTDYICKIAYNNFSSVGTMIDKVPYSPKNLHIMKKIINDSYNKDVMNKILDENKFLSLSWKMKLDKINQEDKLTNFSYFLTK